MKGHKVVGCEAEPEPHGTIVLFRCIRAVTAKSLSKKCLLHTHVLYSNNEE